MLTFGIALGDRNNPKTEESKFLRDVFEFLCRSDLNYYYNEFNYSSLICANSFSEHSYYKSFGQYLGTASNSVLSFETLQELAIEHQVSLLQPDPLGKASELLLAKVYKLFKDKKFVILQDSNKIHEANLFVSNIPVFILEHTNLPVRLFVAGVIDTQVLLTAFADLSVLKVINNSIISINPSTLQYEIHPISKKALISIQEVYLPIVLRHYGPMFSEFGIVKYEKDKDAYQEFYSSLITQVVETSTDLRIMPKQQTTTSLTNLFSLAETAKTFNYDALIVDLPSIKFSRLKTELEEMIKLLYGIKLYLGY